MNVIAMILAGGEGTRLWPLTEERAKPAVPFGGRYRIIDFVLSNFVNSGIYKIKVVTQYKSDSLLKHLLRGWSRTAGFDGFVEPVPPQMNLSRNWYAGSVDAIYQNLNIIKDERPDLVCVFGGDHVYKMDVSQMIDHHVKTGADITVAAIPVPKAEASRFGCIARDELGRMTGFVEKPTDPPEMPDRPGWSLASMGNYIFNADVLMRECERDATAEGSIHDFGRDILPRAYEHKRVQVYDFSENTIRGEDERAKGYWGRHRHDRGLLEGVDGPGERVAGLQPLQREVADPDALQLGAAGEVRVRGPRLAPHRHRDGLDGLRGLHHLRRPHRALRVVAERAPQLLRPRQRVDHLRGREHRPLLAHPSRDHRQGDRDPRGHDDRLRPRRGSEPVLRLRRGHRRHPEARRPRPPRAGVSRGRPSRARAPGRARTRDG
jgi:dTDP-glucose pyrophosphorylase